MPRKVIPHELEREHAKMIKMPDNGLILKNSAYNPANVYEGSPWMPKEFSTPQQVRDEASSMSAKVLEDWKTLKMIVEMHQEVLSKRWLKKTRKHQKELLLSAWPAMSAMHRPDYDAFRRENTGNLSIGVSKFPNSYWWPYINLEDLSSKFLLVFLQGRGQNPPSAFARADV